MLECVQATDEADLSMGPYLRQAFGPDRDKILGLGNFQLQIQNADDLEVYVDLQSCTNDTHTYKGSITNVQVKAMDSSLKEKRRK